MIYTLLMNPYIQYLSFNGFVLLLYLCQLSSFYDIQYEFILYFISVLLFFGLITRKLYNNHDQYLGKIENLLCIKDKRSFCWIIWITFFIGTIASIYQVYAYGATILQENKVGHISGSHYIGYLVDCLQISLAMAYTGIRLKTTRFIFLLKVICVVSIGLLLIRMNRGAFSFSLLVMIYLSFFHASLDHRMLQWKRKMSFILFVVVVLFGFIGDLRLEVVLETFYRMTINELYGMSEVFPSPFVWVYMYLTSPLENASRIFMEQSVWDYHLGLNMIYPFVAPLSKMIFDRRLDLFPPLQEEAGLNTASYMIDAFNDFGYVGPYIYMCYLALIYFIGCRARHHNIYGVFCYLCAVDMGLWMIFGNGLALGSKMMMFLFFLFMTYRENVLRFLLKGSGSHRLDA